MGTGRKERKRCVRATRPKTEDFNAGLKELGAGRWKEIARHFVKTRTGPQVASYAYKCGLTKSQQQLGEDPPKFNSGSWSEKEVEDFKTGLKELGPGRWTEIAQNFVKTRTGMQVSNYARKHG